MEMLLPISASVQQAAIGLLVYVVAAIGLFLYWRKAPAQWYVWVVAVSVPFMYLLLVARSQLTWWGLQGDEIFITAFLQRVASGQFFSDFFYAHLPPFYPPLYFWLIGSFGFLFKLNGVQLAHIGTIVVLCALPLLVFYWQRAYWNTTKHIDAQVLRHPWQWLLSSVFLFIVADWTDVFFKPYEFLSAGLVVLWASFLLRELQQPLHRKRVLFYGVTGGVLFMLYYFWFFIVALAVILFYITKPIELKRQFLQLTQIGIGMLVVASPFVLPLVFSYVFVGFENWQSAFFVFSDLDLYLPFFEPSLFGVVALFGVATLLYFYRYTYARALLSLLAATYVWQLLNVLSLTLFEITFLPGKPFLFFGGAVLSMAAAYGAAQLVPFLQTAGWRHVVAVAGILVFVFHLPAGVFYQQVATQEQLLISRQPLRPEFVELIDSLRKIPELSGLIVLSSGVPQISAYVPLNYYVSYNAHYSHPAALFSKRYAFVQDLSDAETPTQFYDLLQNEGIGGVLFYKGEGEYPVSFWVDDFPTGGRETEIAIPANLIDPAYFGTVFEGKYFVFYRVL